VNHRTPTGTGRYSFINPKLRDRQAAAHAWQERETCPCDCASFLDGLRRQAFTILDNGLIAPKPLALRAAADPALAMRWCPFNGALMDPEAPERRPFQPAHRDDDGIPVCCGPMLALAAGERIKLPCDASGLCQARIIGRAVDEEQAGGAFEAVPFLFCPWCRMLMPILGRLRAAKGAS
jgi:hypothetical protein